ncbi:MAG: hypothetical protein HY399_01405, partial [Elusimicrobia bacterium]|nr:hypothetical protein [Elusimicrobiota bacterium]
MIRAHPKTYFRAAIPAFGLRYRGLRLTYLDSVCSPQPASARRKVWNFATEIGFRMSSGIIFGILVFVAGSGVSQEVSLEKASSEAQKDFEMSMRVLGPSGKKGSGPERTPFNLTAVPIGFA